MCKRADLSYNKDSTDPETRGLRQTVHRCLRYAGLAPEEYRQIKSELHTGNRQSLRNFSLIAAFFLCIMFSSLSYGTTYRPTAGSISAYSC